jgi:hypothetical protein
MMKYLSRTTALVIAIALSGTVGADPAPSSADEPGVDRGTNEAKDWAQTRLSPEPDLREQIGRTQVFLDDNLTAINSEISRLKTQGQLDRRGTSKLRNALNHARESLTRVTESIDTDQQIDGWTARMISYDLGMAADALAQQAGLIEEALNARIEGREGGPVALSSKGNPKSYLVNTLTETSGLLKETARAIVRYLK